MNNSVPFIDDELTIRLFSLAGGQAVIDFETNDGTPREVHSGSFWFVTKDFEKRLQAGPATNQLVLSIQVGELNHLVNKSTQYAIMDRTTGELNAQTVFIGQIIVMDLE